MTWKPIYHHLQDVVPPAPPGAVFARQCCAVSEAFTPWESGLRRYAWTGAKWVRAEAPMTASTWRLVERATAGSPLRPVLESIPPHVSALAEGAGAWKHTAVELMALSPHAFQLAAGSPALFWLVCAAWSSPRGTGVRVRDPAIFAFKRVHLLQWATGQRHDEASLNLLEKVDMGRRDARGLALVRWLLAHRDGPAGFARKLPVVRRVVLEALHRLDGDKDPHALMGLLMHGGDPTQAEVDAYFELRRDVRTMALMLGTAPHDAAELADSPGTLAGLRKLHDDLVMELHCQVAVPCSACGGASAVATPVCTTCDGAGVLKFGSTTPFPPTPVPGTETIVHLPTMKALFAEGQAMHHCVASYGSKAAQGACFLYKVLAPSRATLEITVDAAGNAHIEQLKGPCNEDPGEETMTAVRTWLSSWRAARRGAGRNRPAPELARAP